MSKLLDVFMNTQIGGTYILTTGHLLKSIIFTMILAACMYGVYYLCHDSLTYNRKFNITLVMLAMISTTLLALVQNNPLLSLGVLGSLSICRVRTNTRDPRDIGFVFWALSIGISSAVGAFFTGAVSTVLLGVFMTAASRCIRKRNSMMLVIRGLKDQVADVEAVLGGMKGSLVQSKNLFENSFELVYQLNIPPLEEEKLVLRLRNMAGVSGVNVLAPETRVA